MFSRVLSGSRQVGLLSMRQFSKNFEANSLKVVTTQTPRTKLPNDQLVFGRSFADHMFQVEYEASSGWGTPEIVPYHKLSLEPSAMVFHYALECFEGMKAYKDKNGNIRLFRPMKNMDRLHDSFLRLSFPTFDKTQLLECIKKLVKVDEAWIPTERGYSLYLRPTGIATQESLGVGPSSRVLLFVISSPVGPYYKTGFKAVTLLADTTYVRAWPGGTGNSKVGSNYAPTIMPQRSAAESGYSQILWLYGPDHNVTEVGTMNLFTFWINEKGEKELVTPPLDGTILPGVTRDSIIELSKQWKEFKVSERPFTMKDISKAVEEKRMIEMFGAGTAAIVSPIKMIHYQGKDLHIPLDPENPKSEAGKLTKRISDTIMGIQYGEIPSDWSVIVK